jgi:hypothetical protein
VSYSSQAVLSRDSDFISRLSACAAVEVPDADDPQAWAADHVWHIAAAPGFADAYESAVVGGVERPGNDPSVISDAQILSAVQAAS